MEERRARQRGRFLGKIFDLLAWVHLGHDRRG